MKHIWTKDEEVQHLQKRFDKIKATRKISQAAFARDYGMPGGASMITQHLKSTRPINLEHAMVYAKGFGCALGDISPRLAKLVAEGHATAAGPFTPNGNSLRVIELEDNPDYPAIRRVALKAQAGVSGYSVEYLNDDGPPIVFRADWYKSKGYRPEKLLAVRVTGQSMIPRYTDGDIIVINTQNTEPKDGLIYMVSYEGELGLKRIVREGGEWWLTSDNPDQRRYPRKACNEHTKIVGKVVYHQTENTD